MQDVFSGLPGMPFPFIVDVTEPDIAFDELAQSITDATPPSTIDVRVLLERMQQENIPFHDAASSVPVYVPDWDSFVGQEPMKAQLQTHIQAAAIRCEAMDHVLLSAGMPGVGKTTLARLIAQEMCADLHMLVPPFTIDTLYEAAQQCDEGDVLFIDEIHKLADGSPRGAENLLHMMEERTIYTKGKVIALQEFTIIGATTDADKLPEPVLDRFYIKPYFQPYSVAEMVKIAVNFTRYYSIRLSPEVLVAIAKASRRTPRVARELVSGARDLSTSLGRECTAAELLAFKEFTPDGLTRLHRAYLVNLYSFFGRERKDGTTEYIAGEASMANLLRENRQSVNRIERSLIEIGLVDRTATGRRLTSRGIARAQEFKRQRAGTAVSY